MAKNRVIVSDRFSRVTGDVDRIVQHALVDAAQVAVETAKARGAASRYHLDPITSKITATPPIRHRKGWLVYVYDPDFRARFFEKGTYQKKGAKTSRRQKDVEGNRGVKPIHMLRDGVRAAKPVLLERLRREFG